MSPSKFTFVKLMPLILLIIGLFCFFFFGFYHYLSFEQLKLNHAHLQQWTQQHYALAVLVYFTVYIVVIALSVPGAIWLTLCGGFLFGLWWGTLYTVIAATIGAILLFLAVRTAFGDWLASRASAWMQKLEKGFQKNAFNYLLFLRLIPICPFWAANLVAALLNMRLIPYITATFIGIIPGTFVFVLLGHGLSEIFARNETPNFGIIFKPYVLIPLLALAVLTLVPIIYRKAKHVS